MDRSQLTPEVLEEAEWFCKFGLLVADVQEAHPSWTHNEIAQELLTRVVGVSEDEMRYWVDLVFQAVATWQQIRQEREHRASQ